MKRIVSILSASAAALLLLFSTKIVRGPPLQIAVHPPSFEEVGELFAHAYPGAQDIFARAAGPPLHVVVQPPPFQEMGALLAYAGARDIVARAPAPPHHVVVPSPSFAEMEGLLAHAYASAQGILARIAGAPSYFAAQPFYFAQLEEPRACAYEEEREGVEVRGRWIQNPDSTARSVAFSLDQEGRIEAMIEIRMVLFESISSGMQDLGGEIQELIAMAGTPLSTPGQVDIERFEQLSANLIQRFCEQFMGIVAPMGRHPLPVAQSGLDTGVVKTLVEDFFVVATVVGEQVPSMSGNLTDFGKEAPSQPTFARYPFPKRIDAGHIEGKGIGTTVGYTQLAMVFGPEYQLGQFLPLVELRGIVYDDLSCGANVGFIGRFLPKSLCQVYGFNLFYDLRQGKLGNYNQVGGGFNVLAKRWEVHANASIPVGHYSRVQHCVFDHYTDGFRAERTRYERADAFMNATAGYYPIVSKRFQLYTGGGPYYIFGGGGGQSALGAKALVRPQFMDWAIELSVSHDAIFQTIWQINVVFTLPLYNLSPRLKDKTGPCGVSNYQIYSPIDHRDVILRRRCCWDFNW